MSEKTLARAKGWSEGLGEVEDREGSFVVGSGPSLVEVGWDAEAEAIVVRGVATVDPADATPAPNAPTFEELVGTFAMTRTGLLTATVVEGGDLLEVRVELPVYEDGLTQHTFRSAVAEVRKSLDGVRSLLDDFRRQKEVLAGLDAITVASAPEPEPEPDPLPEAPVPVADPVPVVAEPEPVAPTPASSAAWTRTHVVPAAGMAAWDAPDPNRQPVATLQAGVELQVVEWLGAWAHVRAANGWTGFVDGRVLVSSP